MEKKVKKAPWLYVVRYGTSVVACYTSAFLCVALVKTLGRYWAVRVERFRQFFPDAHDCTAIEVEREDITDSILKSL